MSDSDADNRVIRTEFGSSGAGDMPQRSGPKPASTGVIRASFGDDRRQQPRYMAHGGRVQIHHGVYELVDLSRGGLRIRGYNGSMVAGTTFDFTFLLKIGDEEVDFPGVGVVVRADGEELAAQYLKPKSAFLEYVDRYIDCAARA